MHIELPKPVTKAIGLLESAGFEAWVVGGAVRDAMAAEMARASMQTQQGNPAADGKEQATGEQHQEQPAPQDWDLTTNAGSPVHTGVYLYRARVRCDESDEVTKTQKLIINRAF